MKKALLSLLIIPVFYFAGCGGNSAPVAAETSAVAGFTIELSDSIIEHRRADTLHLGRIRSGEVIAKDIIIHNAGSTPLVILGLDLSCGCVQADYPRPPIKPGESAVMPLTFDSSGLTGWAFKPVFIKTSLDTRSFGLMITADIE